MKSNWLILRVGRSIDTKIQEVDHVDEVDLAEVHSYYEHTYLHDDREGTLIAFIDLTKGRSFAYRVRSEKHTWLEATK